MPLTLPAQIGCLGRYLVALLQPWAAYGRAGAVDSTILLANGGVWHKKDRDKGVVPHTSIDTEAHWTKSGWHGWRYGWKLHLVATIAAVWIPLAADLTPANEADNESAPALLRELPAEARFVLGDLHCNAPNVQECYDQARRILLTMQYGPYPHTGDGVEVRRMFHKLRSTAIENFNEQFEGIFDGHGQGLTQYPTLCSWRHPVLLVGAPVSFSTRPTFVGWTQGFLEGGLMNYDQASLSHRVGAGFSA
jgi:hypothetical protein